MENFNARSHGALKSASLCAKFCQNICEMLKNPSKTSNNLLLSGTSSKRNESFLTASQPSSFTVYRDMEWPHVRGAERSCHFKTSSQIELVCDPSSTRRRTVANLAVHTYVVCK